MRLLILLLLIILPINSYGGIDYASASSNRHSSTSWSPIVTVSNNWQIALWFRPDSDPASDMGVFAMSRAGSDNTSVCWITLLANNTVEVQSGLTAIAATSNTVVVGEWNSIIAARDKEASTFTIVLNGDWANRGTVTAGGTSNLMGRTSIGSLVQGIAGFSTYFNGAISDVTVWYNVGDWNAQDLMLQWHSGRSPYNMFSVSPTCYFQLSTSQSTIYDSISGNSLDVNGSPATTDVKSIIKRSSPSYSFVPTNLVLERYLYIKIKPRSILERIYNVTTA